MLVGGTDLRIRRTERTHELRRLITASKAKGSIRSAPILAFTCMRGRKNDATYFAQKLDKNKKRNTRKATKSCKNGFCCQTSKSTSSAMEAGWTSKYEESKEYMRLNTASKTKGSNRSAPIFCIYVCVSARERRCIFCTKA